MKPNFHQNRTLFWILLFLIILNLGAFFTWFVISRPAPQEASCIGPGCNLLSQELGLSEQQSAVAGDILSKFRAESEPVASSIRETRGRIIQTLSEENPDTLQLQSMTRELADLQVTLQEINLRQFLALKKICTPEQMEKLSSIYLEAHGCQIKNGEKGPRNHQNRHRHQQ